MMEAEGKAKFETTEQISSQIKDVILRKSPQFLSAIIFNTLIGILFKTIIQCCRSQKDSVHCKKGKRFSRSKAGCNSPKSPWGPRK
jgi:hypothetical protein